MVKAEEVLHPAKPAADPDQRMKHLETLLEIGSAVGSIRDLEALEEKILELICAVIPADRGAILLVRRARRICLHLLLDPQAAAGRGRQCRCRAPLSSG